MVFGLERRGQSQLSLQMRISESCMEKAEVRHNDAMYERREIAQNFQQQFQFLDTYPMLQ